MYPDYELMTEGIFGTIKYFSLTGKDGEVLVNVLQKQADDPIQGAIPMLKVDSVSDWIAKFGAMGGKVVIPQVVCPCTQTYDDLFISQPEIRNRLKPASDIISR
jgi:hypothetical protein